MRKQHGGSVQVFRITGARTGLAEDVRARQRRYVISMSIRTLSVILTAVMWNVERHVALVALVVGMLLPYVAVVIANAGRERPPNLPSTYVSSPVSAYVPPALPRGPEDGARTTGRDAGGEGRRAAPEEPGDPVTNLRKTSDQS
ncbi:DUF3099 domain-containing protein [Streptomyces sp. J2-1]|uniref:DUF3099 domain-containing protein n=1 Tax=Streptomyces corallincola TaxID=2851888 RepID=UPI001C37F8EB|nr:DUF3099 domain-containing protein [Streptomyces corallincola]MBV2355085.1 DUF3099 domain-containing protein [Streptomyces corallincola]